MGTSGSPNYQKQSHRYLKACISCSFKYVTNILDFFIALDHENGPITLHSSILNVVKYVQAGIQMLRHSVEVYCFADTA